MTIIEDSRQQTNKHTAKNEYWQAEGINVLRSKLAFGDYALPPKVSIDTKQDIYELAQDIDQQHARFKRELIGAKDCGCQLIILVENTDGVQNLDDLTAWNESTGHFQMRLNKNPNAKRISGSRLAKACKTMSERYGARFEFCTPREAGRRVKELLENG